VISRLCLGLDSDGLDAVFDFTSPAFNGVLQRGEDQAMYLPTTVTTDGSEICYRIERLLTKSRFDADGNVKAPKVYRFNNMYRVEHTTRPRVLWTVREVLDTKKGGRWVGMVQESRGYPVHLDERSSPAELRDAAKELQALVNDDTRAVGSDPGASWKAATSDGRCIPCELLVPRNTQPAAPAPIDSCMSLHSTSVITHSGR
jgi:hypothetical protein